MKMLFSIVCPFAARIAGPAPLTKMQLRTTDSGREIQMCSLSSERDDSMSPLWT